MEPRGARADIGSLRASGNRARSRRRAKKVKCRSCGPGARRSSELTGALAGQPAGPSKVKRRRKNPALMIEHARAGPRY